MGKKISIKILAILTFLAMIVSFSCFTLSKYVFQDSGRISASYTDFIVNCNGDGKTAVLRAITDTNLMLDEDGKETYAYIGYVAVEVTNFEAGSDGTTTVSARDVMFEMRVPTSEEIDNGKVTDAWGEVIKLASDSGNYDVQIYSSTDGTTVTTGGTEFKLEKNGQRTRTITLQIRRKATTPDLGREKVENFSVILQTSEPYMDLRVIGLSASLALISVNTTEKDYHGVPEKIVNLQSSVDFSTVESGTVKPMIYKATVVFTLDNVVFDMERFLESYNVISVEKTATDAYVYSFDGNVTCEESADKKVYTLTLWSGTDLNLYFYYHSSDGAMSVKATATIDNVTVKISGTNVNDYVFAQT